MKFEQPKLNYDHKDLEPYIDSKTIEIHYSKHHATYTAKLNEVLEKAPGLFDKKIEDILRNLDQVPEEIRESVKNNGGGYANHNLYWEVMTPGGSNLPEGVFKNKIERDFGSLSDLQQKVSSQALARFGSGWAWLVVNAENNLEVISTPNQDSPITLGKTPLLALDVWEHAYYLKYQNKRNDYIENWWNIVNWQRISELFTLYSM